MLARVQIDFSRPGYVAIRHTIPEAILRHKGLPHQDLSPVQIEFWVSIACLLRFSSDVDDAIQNHTL
jgi:hypothetical protein